MSISRIKYIALLPTILALLPAQASAARKTVDSTFLMPSRNLEQVVRHSYNEAGNNHLDSIFSGGVTYAGTIVKLYSGVTLLKEEEYNTEAKKVRETTFNSSGIATRVVLIMTTGGAPSNVINSFTYNGEGKLTREENKKVSNPAQWNDYTYITDYTYAGQVGTGYTKNGSTTMRTVVLEYSENRLSKMTLRGGTDGPVLNVQMWEVDETSRLRFFKMFGATDNLTRQTSYYYDDDLVGIVRNSTARAMKYASALSISSWVVDLSGRSVQRSENTVPAMLLIDRREKSISSSHLTR